MLCEIEEKINILILLNKTQYLTLLCYPHLMCSTLGNMAHLDRAAIEGE